MTAGAPVAGRVWRAPDRRVSGSGKPFGADSERRQTSSDAAKARRPLDDEIAL
jgi:hypothetical protein